MLKSVSPRKNRSLPLVMLLLLKADPARTVSPPVVATLPALVTAPAVTALAPGPAALRLAPVRLVSVPAVVRAKRLPAEAARRCRWKRKKPSGHHGR